MITVSGLKDWHECHHCGGTGIVTVKKGRHKGKTKPCPECKGHKGWWVPFGLAIAALIAILLYL